MIKSKWLYSSIILFPLLILLFSHTLLSNPIAVPSAIISELLFNNNTDWDLEISINYGELYHSQDFDSLCLETASGFSRIKLDNWQENTSLFVIGPENLSSPLSIDRNGDFIKLYSYPSPPFQDAVLIDSLAFGNYPGSICDSLQIGYSLCRLSYIIFSKDKSPTIGLPNDTTGTCGTLYGHIYDINNDLVTTGKFRLQNPVTFNVDGSFATRVFSRKSVEILIDTSSMSGQYSFARIESLYINIEPDSLLRKDIHLLFDYLDVVAEQYTDRNYKLSVINYPHPFNTTTRFSIKVPPSLIYQKGSIKIFNVTGQEIKNIVFSSNLSTEWDGTNNSGLIQPSGIYYYQLIFDNQVYKKGSVLFLK
jgi:hypothetical protein